MDEPDIAACAGAFQFPGVIGPAAVTPMCARAAGNDGTNVDGMGCTVADLCALGFHVCTGAADVAASAATGACPSDGGPMGRMWLTSQAEEGLVSGSCVPNGTNNLVGCGSLLGSAPSDGPSWAPLNLEMRWDDCDAWPPWSCPINSAEPLVVTKSGPGRGGVLC